MFGWEDRAQKNKFTICHELINLAIFSISKELLYFSRLNKELKNSSELRLKSWISVQISVTC